MRHGVRKEIRNAKGKGEMAILIIDDESMLRHSLGLYLEDMEFQVLEAENGLQGLEVLKANRGSLEAVIVDLNMPVMDGYGFLQEAVNVDRELPIVVLSGVGVMNQALRAMRLGAWGFITKPITNLGILNHTLDKVMARARLLVENRNYQENLESQVSRKVQELESLQSRVIRRLSRMAEFKEDATGLHVARVGEISAILAEALDFRQEAVHRLRECAALHDLGKLGVPDAILLKRGELDAREREVMRTHCIKGCAILAGPGAWTQVVKSCAPAGGGGWGTTLDSERLSLARTLVMHHHEKWDGSGYPTGLAGPDIPLEARIVALAEVFDALCCDRSYRPAYPLEKSVRMVREESGIHFDPAVVDAFFRNLDAIQDVVAARKG